MQWRTKPFSDLTVAELYAALQLRAGVFVVEQNCVYQDLDNHDQNSWHVMGWEGDALLAYCRVLPAGEKYTEWSIGRVATAPSGRGKGLGQQLTTQAIAAVTAQGGRSIRISAQAYLEKFYNGHGFKPVSAPYDEDGIAHIEMLREAA